MSRVLSEQENIRLSPEFKSRFEEAVKRGSHCKAKLIRSLIEAWVEEQEQAR